MPRFGATNVRVRRRPRVGWIVAAAVAVPLLLTLAGLTLLAGLVVLGGLFLFFMLPAVLYEDSLLGERRVATLTADRAGVSFGERLVLQRRRIDATAIEPLADGGCQVELWGKRASDDLTLFVDDERRAELLLEALGLASDRHVARFVVESAPLRTRATARLVAALRLGGGLTIGGAVVWAMGREPLAGFALVPLLWVYGAIVRLLRRRRRITLGNDALVVRGPIPLATIEGVVSLGDRDARVDRTGGDSLLLRFDGRGAKDKRDAFVARLSQSMARAAGATHLGALLAPGGRSAEAWLRELRRLGGEGYRGGGVPPEELWRVVEHHGAEPGARAGALAALLASGTKGASGAPSFAEEERMRVEAMSEGTVSADLRAALAAGGRDGATDEGVVHAFLRTAKR